MKRRIGALVLMVSVLSTAFWGTVFPAYAVTPEPVVSAPSAILIDGATGDVLYEKDSHAKKYPASTTKIITAILAIENLKMDDVLTVDADTPFTEGSRMYLVEGEEISVKDLLYGMMTESANDAAVALGKEVSGSVDEFAKLMNQKMKEVGGDDSNFVNPNGLHDEQHMTSANDLARIARYAMKDEQFRDVVATYRYIIPATNKQEIRYMYNSNRMLYDEKTKVQVNGVKRGCKYDGVTGIKTGYTSHAGGTLVASAKRGDTELIAVVMQSTDKGRFADCITMLDWGFENYKTMPAMDAGTALGEVKVKRGAVSRVQAGLKEAVVITAAQQTAADQVSTKIVLDDSVTAPVKKGAVIGKVQVYNGTTLLKEVDAVAEVSVKKGGVLSIFGIQDATSKKLGIGIGVVIGLFVAAITAYILLKRRQIRIRKQRRRERQERVRQKEEEKLQVLEQLRRENGFNDQWPNYRARRK